METFVIHPKDAEQSQAIKAFLKALKVKVEVFSDKSSFSNTIPKHVSVLMDKALIEADQNNMTPHENFMNDLKKRLKK